MEPIKILVCGNQAAFVKSHLITAGTVGLPVEFTFDEQWEGLSKTAVFKAGNIVRDQININQQTTVPAEVLAKPKRQLEIGVYGINEDGTVVLPTVWVTAGQIVPGADPFGDEGTEPSLPVWEQAQKGTVKYTPQKLNEEQKVQARQNIGAMQNGVADTNLNMNGHDIYGATSVLIKKKTEQEDDAYVQLFVESTVVDQEGVSVQVLGFDSLSGGNVVMRYVQPGIVDWDAATVGQVNAVKSYIIPVYTGGESPVIDGEFNWDELAKAVTSNRFTAIISYNNKTENGAILIPGASVRIYPLSDLDTEDGIAFFGINDFKNHIRYTIYRDGSLEYKVIPNASDRENSLIVRLSEDRTTASATPADIYAHIQNGGTVVLEGDGSRYYPLSYCSENFAEFSYVSDDYTAYNYRINGTGKVILVELTYASAEGLLEVKKNIAVKRIESDPNAAVLVALSDLTPGAYILSGKFLYYQDAPGHIIFFESLVRIESVALGHTRMIYHEPCGSTRIEFDNGQVYGPYYTVFQTQGNIKTVIDDTTNDDAYYPSVKATKNYVDGITGDIEAALDSIIAIQESLIGGASQ